MVNYRRSKCSFTSMVTVLFRSRISWLIVPRYGTQSDFCIYLFCQKIYQLACSFAQLLTLQWQLYSSLYACLRAKLNKMTAQSGIFFSGNHLRPRKVKRDILFVLQSDTVRKSRFTFCVINRLYRKCSSGLFRSIGCDLPRWVPNND